MTRRVKNSPDGARAGAAVALETQKDVLLWLIVRVAGARNAPLDRDVNDFRLI